MAWLESWNRGIGNFLAPSAAFADSGMTEAQIAAAQRNARMQLAAGLFSGVGSGGASLAKGIGAGLQGVANANDRAMQTAYQNTLLKKQQDREDRLLQAQEAALQRQEREQAAITASRLTQGMESASDPAAYWALVQNMPEVQSMLRQYQLDPTMTDPAQLRERLSMQGQLGMPYEAQSLELKAVVDPSTGQPVYRPEAQAVGMRPYYESAAGPTANELAQQAFNRANVLRDEYSAQTKDFRTQEAMFGNIQATAKNPSAAGDIALLTSFMKLNDPTSTVREGEFATAENAGGIDTRVRAQYNKLLTGERLTPEQRADFVGQSTEIFNQQKKVATRIRSQYRELATRARVDPLDVVGADEQPQGEYTATNAQGQKIVWRNNRWEPY